MSEKFKFGSRKRKNVINFLKLTDNALNTDMLKGSHTEIFSNRQIIIDGCKGVYDYKSDYIRLNLGKGSMVLCGSDFDIVVYENDAITIRGNITTLEFCL